MTKLQKKTPPAYPGLATENLPLEGAARYESFPPSTRQPIPLNPFELQIAVSGGLGDNNPYNASNLQAVPSPQQVFSPVSPLEAPVPAPAPIQPSQNTSVSTSHIHAPRPHRQSMDARKSVDLRRLDGTPYNDKKVKVAKDMHEGALPPAYKRDTSDPVHATELARPANPETRAHDCTKCGKSRQSGAEPHNCTKCGKHKSTASSAPQSRAVSQTIAPMPRVAAPTSPTAAGPSAMPTRPPCCTKCGKKKKPVTAPIQQQPFSEYPRGPNSAPLEGPRLTRPQRPGVSIMQAPQFSSVNPQIDIVPPSASTYRPNSLQSPFNGSQYGDETPLVGKATPQHYSLLRNSSLVRSLSRRLSGKDKRASTDGPLPSQQLRASQIHDGEQGTGRLINMISKAINESGEGNQQQQQYARLSAQEQPSRPSSPFSFMETPDENQAYEMKDMKDGKEKALSPKSPQSEQSMYSPVIIEETLDVDVDRRSKSMQQTGTQNSPGLGVPGQEGNRPPLTRFKSLRQGVNRAASVSRATSLRRLESLKTVHTAWYRDDMAIEGHNGESVSVPVY